MQKIIFVTGKGGVGKSTYAAHLAYKYSKSGRKTLLVELGDESYFNKFLNITKVSYQPETTLFGFDLSIWTGRDCLKEYALQLLRSESLYNLFFENKLSRSLINIAPGLAELAILGKITSGPRRHGPSARHDVIIIDSFATGHFLALIRAPKGMMEAIKYGPMGEQSRSIIETMKNESICEYHLVCLPEELPITEVLELESAIHNELNIKSKIIVNKWWRYEKDLVNLPSDDNFFNLLKIQLDRQVWTKRTLDQSAQSWSNFPMIFTTSAEDIICKSELEMNP